MRAWNLGYEKAKAKAKEIYVKIGKIQSPVRKGGQKEFMSIMGNNVGITQNDTLSKNTKKPA